MKYIFFLSLYIVSMTSWGCIDEAKDTDCEMNAMEVFLPDSMRYPTKNVRLERFQYATEKGAVYSKISSDVLDNLHKSVDIIAAKVFKDSRSDFEVLIRITLLTQGAATVDMKISGVDKSEASLREFYDNVKALKGFQSLKDKVYVVLHYSISKSESSKKSK